MEPVFNDSILKIKKARLNTDQVTKHLLSLKNDTASKKLFLVKEASIWIEEAKHRPIPKCF
jgi:hypothetical protein